MTVQERPRFTRRADHESNYSHKLASNRVRSGCCRRRPGLADTGGCAGQLIDTPLELTALQPRPAASVPDSVAGKLSHGQRGDNKHRRGGVRYKERDRAAVWDRGKTRDRGERHNVEKTVRQPQRGEPLRRLTGGKYTGRPEQKRKK